ncbi:MAG TPA: hypothetical protein VN822_13675 [Candidatus Acidoferrales bacterium]|nr:hypothetical protein [Candidatus Acidoferrales bacterium]
MRRLIALLLLAIVPGAISAQSKPPQKADPDRMGMTCAQILQMTSSDWVAKSTSKDASNIDSHLRAIRAYGRCYDERTDRLAALLARGGKGPTKAARADFVAFESALKDFAAKALADAQPPADSQKTSYANLYEKQFRYIFYQEYEAKAVKPAPSAMKPPAPAATPPAHTDSPPSADSPHTATAQERARSDADPMTMAKNRFGKILEPLPDDQMHELHRAFGEVIGAHPISEQTRLAVYRYAISILEPPSATPFAPPPF